jgi:hypothetical protein
MTDLPLHTCMGASDSILDHSLCFSSAATTPLTLDPIGSPALLIRTQALSSNLTTLPSGRCHFFAVRTTTACRTSPRRTLFAALMDTLLPVSGPKFRCFLTTTTMRSPARVNCPFQPHFGRLHTNFRRSLRSQDVDALDYGSARVVDAVDEGLEMGCMSGWFRRVFFVALRTLS